ncbi:MAG: hypothetical protein LBS62_03380 [Clostridiales bacterium]|jgi:hypothetical protein|nr:hypothetical protein [Clostridiales bacterium]
MKEMSSKYRWEKVGSPCRNFCFLGRRLVTDPRGGHEMLALTSYAYPQNGQLLLADAETGEMEIHPFPTDAASWPLEQLGDGSLLLGTCVDDGAVLRFDMLNRKWREPLKTGETYLWRAGRGSDGMYYFSTTPHALLIRYDPRQHRIENLGSCTDVAGNLYSFEILTEIPGKIFINCSFEKNQAARYDIGSGTLRKAFIDDGHVAGIFGGCLIIRYSDGKLGLSDAEGRDLLGGSFTEDDFKAVEHPAVEKYFKSMEIDPRIKDWKGEKSLFNLKNGGAIGIRGQEIFIIRPGSVEAEILPFTVEPPNTQIIVIAPDHKGNLWGAPNFGMTIFRYNPETGETWNSTTACYDFGGEFYGMVPINGKIYMSAYCMAGHILYDTEKPWDAWDGLNPRCVYAAAPEYNRPYAKSVADNNGYVWTGLHSKYGTREMAISRWDTQTDEIRLYEKIAPGKTVHGMGTDGDNIWFTTSGAASSLAEDKEMELDLYAIDAEGKVIFHENLGREAFPGAVAFAGKYGLVSVGHQLYAIDGEKLEIEKIPGVTLANLRLGVERCGSDTVAAFDSEVTYIVNPKEKKTAAKAPPLKDPFWSGTVLGGTFYVVQGRDIYRLREETL